MNKLLYYPNFEIQDQDFLKFALLFIDEIRPIIPERAKGVLSSSMQSIIRNTDLINPYSPKNEDRILASAAAISHLEDRRRFYRYSECRQGKICGRRDYVLYADKYAYEFENYCLENSLGERCNEGVLLNRDIAYVYMTILAEIISKETETDMITDDEKYSDPVLRGGNRRDSHKIDMLGAIQKEIQFLVPNDMNKISLDKFIELRSDKKFEMARRNFVKELNTVLDLYDRNVSEVNLENVVECRKEINGLMKDLLISCATVTVGVLSFGSVCTAETGSLDFWSNIGGMGLGLVELKQSCYEAREFAKRIERKRKARKYLAKLKQLRAELI